MALEHIDDKVLETDVLVIGGGIAGCAAAAKAAEHGLNVTLTEKSKTDRSGTSGQGIDHYGGALPRGMTPQEFLRNGLAQQDPFPENGYFQQWRES